jgi:Tol biopolymer transport system component
VVSPDGKSLAVGGADVTVVPLEGGRERKLVKSDGNNRVMPVLWGEDGEIMYVTRDVRAPRQGMRDIWLVRARGGVARHVGALPGACNLNINVLRGGKEATCHASEQLVDAWIVHRLPR